jgi:low affinity Fe/Cu permease
MNGLIWFIQPEQISRVGGVVRETFRTLADRTAVIVGSPWAFVTILMLSVVWLLLGPVFHFSDTWQLTMNTVASQVTFLVAFLLQSTQNRDTRALQLKLDELIRSTGGAREQLLRLEQMSDDDLDRLQAEFEALRRRRARD